MVGCTVLCTLYRTTARVVAHAPAPRHLVATAPLRRAAPARATRRAFTATVVAQGLQKNVIQEGSGPSPTPGDKVSASSKHASMAITAVGVRASPERSEAGQLTAPDAHLSACCCAGDCALHR